MTNSAATIVEIRKQQSERMADPDQNMAAQLLHQHKTIANLTAQIQELTQAFQAQQNPPVQTAPQVALWYILNQD